MACAAPGAEAATDLGSLSFEQLMNTEVTIAAATRTPRRVGDTAAAATVLTREDIRRSGATSIPEALRLAPGVQVSRIDSSRWSISIRGFNGVFSNKLLVIIDGRTVYTPLFAGVYWNAQDVVLEDVERIEVVRGPSATLWGSNAVNGVISIVTRSARDTHGELGALTFGNYERYTGTYRHGGRAGNVDYRVYAKAFERAPFDTARFTPSVDDWNVQRGGFRTDWSESARDRVTVQGDVYAGDAGETIQPLTSAFLADPTVRDREDYSGSNLVGRWQRDLARGGLFQVQAYVDRTDRANTQLDERRDTADLEVLRAFRTGRANSLVLGASYRSTADRIASINPGLRFDPPARTTELYSFFFSDELELMPRRLFVTLGNKFEHNDFTGWELQPTLRALYHLSGRRSVWGAYSRAVRIPTRVEQDLTVSVPVPGLPAEFRLLGSRDFDSETAGSFELGYRQRFSTRLSLDVTAYQTDYRRLASTDSGRPFVDFGPPPRLVLPAPFTNNIQAWSRGGEVFVTWDAARNTHVFGSYSRFDADTAQEPGVTLTGRSDAVIGESPKHQYQVRTQFNPRPRVELDAIVTHVIPATVPDYTRADLRLGWRFRPLAMLDLVIQDMISDRHLEVGGLTSTFVVPSRYAKVTWQF